MSIHVPHSGMLTLHLEMNLWMKHDTWTPGFSKRGSKHERGGYAGLVCPLGNTATYSVSPWLWQRCIAFSFQDSSSSRKYRNMWKILYFSRNCDFSLCCPKLMTTSLQRLTRAFIYFNCRKLRAFIWSRIVIDAGRSFFLCWIAVIGRMSHFSTAGTLFL